MASSDPYATNKDTPLKIVPRGLCAFDVHDADYFLELLPGPRDREGLPDSIRFWKAAIEETDPQATFPVGLIYGPSGCGKSSFVKAGLLPRLSHDVFAVYLEATPEDTETRLLYRLRSRCAALNEDLNLKDSLAALRCGKGIPAGTKLLIVLDQFEQWLRVHEAEELTELARALRQCDGGRLQCIVMVRDDFWLATTRFMAAVEVELKQGQNSALVDMFDLDHARNVLAAFGRAFGKLPQYGEAISKQQELFLRQAVSGLAEEGKVMCVRLSLFAEMMKGKAWTTKTLKEAGGAQGVGITFLETTFSARTANPKHRLHQQAARAVLKALLPESGSIKGQMKTADELLDASGYASRPQDFDDLIRILDSELHLITPTESAAGDGRRMAGEDGDVTVGATAGGIGANSEQFEVGTVGPATHHPPPATFYQLTHDYLVLSLRAWLTRKQRETPQGRAELCLTERNDFWSHKREDRRLPSALECLRIAYFTKARDWSDSQREMMRRARRMHKTRWGTVLLMVLAVSLGIAYAIEAKKRRILSDRTSVLVSKLKDAQGPEIGVFTSELRRLRKTIVYDELRKAFETHRSLALAYARAELSERVEDVDFVVACVGAAAPDEVDYLVGILDHASSASLQVAIRKAAVKTKDWRLKARLAIVALHLQDSELAASMCELGPNSTQRSTFINECTTWHGDLKHLAKALPETIRGPLKSGLCCAVGSVPPDRRQSNEAQRAWADIFRRWYQDADAGTHGAAGWALRAWKIMPPQNEKFKEIDEKRGWFFVQVGNQTCMTMLKIPAGTIWKGQKYEIRVRKSFWLADREVTVGVFREFAKTHDPEWSPDMRYTQYVEPTDSHPVSQVGWNKAVEFCNWLSENEGLQTCYQPVGEEGTASRWRIKDEPTDGYRLPTQEEYRFASRAGAETVYPCCDDESDEPEFFHHYAIHMSSRPGFTAGGPESCGSRLPNGWGLFDMYGNVCEWCAPSAPTQFEDDAIELLGGAALWQPKHWAVFHGHSIRYEDWQKTFAWRLYGFRVARSSSEARLLDQTISQAGSASVWAHMPK